jgi:UrcA family protein
MKTLALVTTLLIGSLAATANATTTTVPTENVRQAVVSFADLDLETQAGAQTLLNRIKFAARRVCGVYDAGLLAMEFRAQLHRCAAQATARAVADVDARTIVVADAR